MPPRIWYRKVPSVTDALLPNNNGDRMVTVKDCGVRPPCLAGPGLPSRSLVMATAYRRPIRRHASVGADCCHRPTAAPSQAPTNGDTDCGRHVPPDKQWNGAGSVPTNGGRDPSFSAQVVVLLLVIYVVLDDENVVGVDALDGR
jgi:hypothetical protein